MITSLSAAKLFTGSHWLSEMLITFENGKIISIAQEGYAPSNAMPFVVPALIDLQIYGAENKFTDLL